VLEKCLNSVLVCRDSSKKNAPRDIIYNASNGLNLEIRYDSSSMKQPYQGVHTRKSRVFCESWPGYKWRMKVIKLSASWCFLSHVCESKD
jgi:hypothetical protein